MDALWEPRVSGYYLRANPGQGQVPKKHGDLLVRGQDTVLTAKAKVGYYQTVAARKYVDGVESTYLLTKEVCYEVNEEERKAKGTEELKDAVAILRGSSPSRSEDKAYKEVGRQDVWTAYYEMEGDQVLFGRTDDEDKKKVTPMKGSAEENGNKLLARARP
jgi:hypothetical protein